MATKQDISVFGENEDVVFTIAAKDRDGTVIATPASQTLTVVIARRDGTKVIEVNTTPEVELTGAVLGVWTVTLRASALTDLIPGYVYRYDVWTESADSPPETMWQAGGSFRLQNTNGPA